MENASKALIIAGAILLAILIIGLGMTIFNQARDTLSQANLDQETIAAFNSKFDNYISDKLKGTDVRTLCDLVRNNNLAVDMSTTFPISIDVGGKKVTAKDEKTAKESASKINDAKNSVVKGATYKVTATYNATNGLIETITAAKNK